jgi:4-hydroxybenzoate polyprenyltransferase
LQPDDKLILEKRKTSAAGSQLFSPSAWFRALRLHQWSKNLLVLTPVIAGHKLGDPAVLLRATLGMAAFCFCASGVYVVNDLVDLKSDRAHPAKCRRPFAAGELSITQGLCAALLLFVVSFVCGLFLPWMFLFYLAVYCVASTLYSFLIKKLMLLDVFALAGLYTLRILAGHGATGIRYSSWLLGFSMFLFLSLALLKRYIELHRVNLTGRTSALGRGYVTGDLPLMLSLGPLSGWLAVLVLSLYINSDDVRLLYHHPFRLLLACPLLLYWISRVWLLATRDLLHDDPVVFALKDWGSYVVGGLTALVVWFASI